MPGRSWNKLKLPPPRILAHVGFWVALGVIVLMGAALFEATRQQMEASASANHSRSVLRIITELSGSVSRAESATRGFLISSDPNFLSERDAALESAKQAGVRLLELKRSMPEQAATAAELHRLLEARAALMEYSTAHGAGTAESFETSTVAGKQATRRIEEIAQAMIAEERAALDAESAKEAARQARAQQILFLAIVVSILVLVPGYIGYALQAGARTRAERVLRDTAETLPGALFRIRTDRDGRNRFEFLSQTVEPLRAVSREAAMRDFSVMWHTIHDDDRARIRQEMQEALARLGPVQYDFRVKHPEGERWLRAWAYLRRDADGSVVWNGYWADITEQKRLETELHEARASAEAANRAKSTFLATMSHEIRTPMNGVLGMLELLSLTRLDPEQRTTVEVIRQSGKSLQRIIDDILDFSKIEAGKLELRPEPFSVADVVRSAVNIYSGNASSKGILLLCSIDEAISPALFGDGVRVQQVLNNLISNAIKFAPAGSVEVGAELVRRDAAGETVRFSVRDRGPGISPEEQQRLFQPFAQGHRAGERTAGTGLGLAICRRLAELMGGTIEMESAPGKGTRVALVVTLPLADGEAPARKADASIPPPAPLRQAPSVSEAERERTLVLVVDDHPTNRDLLLRQVNMLGYAAESAAEGVEALAKWQSGRFAMLITDCNMPEMDGYQLAQRIRETEAASELRRTPIVACTANALGGEAERCLAAGMDDYLAKPVRLADLAKKLSHWLPLHGAPIDRALLAEVSGGDPEVEGDILREFRLANDADVSALRAAVRSAALGEVVRASHRIKGSSRVIGAGALAQVCERLEAAGRSGDAVALAAGMAAFDEQLSRLNLYIDTLPEGAGKPAR